MVAIDNVPAQGGSGGGGSGTSRFSRKNQGWIKSAISQGSQSGSLLRSWWRWRCWSNWWHWVWCFTHSNGLLLQLLELLNKEQVAEDLDHLMEMLSTAPGGAGGGGGGGNY